MLLTKAHIYWPFMICISFWVLICIYSLICSITLWSGYYYPPLQMRKLSLTCPRGTQKVSGSGKTCTQESGSEACTGTHCCNAHLHGIGWFEGNHDIYLLIFFFPRRVIQQCSEIWQTLFFFFDIHWNFYLFIFIELLLCKENLQVLNKL